MFQYDLHCHTKETSPCGNVPASALIAEYRKAGYSGIVVTDHFYRGAKKSRLLHRPKDFLTYFLTGYHALQKEAGPDFTVLLGMELRFDENQNDYLVFGVTEDFLRRQDGLELCALGIQDFSKIARQEGLLVVQAHPFRKGLVQAPAECLDGIEVHNGNPRHNSHNDLALQWAENTGLIQTSGSDYHEYEDLARGGIATEERITTSSQLIHVLKSGRYQLLRGK